MKTNSWPWIAVALLCVAGSGCRKNSGSGSGGNSGGAKESKVTGSPSDPPVSLTAKWTPGRRYVMRMESAQTMQMPNMLAGRGRGAGAGTNAMTVENNFAQEYALAVTNGPDGQRGLEMEILAFELMAGQGDQQLNYDSRNKVVRGGGPLGDVFDRLIGGKIYYLLSPENKVLKVDGIQELFARVEAPSDNPAAGGRAGARMAAPMLRGMYNEDMFKQMIDLAGAPPQAVRVGESWTDSRTIGVPTVGKLTVTTTNTLRGWQEHDGKKCARIDFTGAITSADEGTSGGAMPVRVSLKSGSLTGRYWFAPEIGLATDTAVEQDYLLSMSGQLGRPPARGGGNAAETETSFAIPVHQNVSVKLLEVKAVSE